MTSYPEPVFGTVKESLSEGAMLLRSSPALLVPAVFMALLHAAQYVTLEAATFLRGPALVVYPFVAAYFFAGLFAALGDDRVGGKGLVVFVRGGLRHYPRFLAAFAVFAVVFYPFNLLRELLAIVARRRFFGPGPEAYPPVEVWGFVVGGAPEVAVVAAALLLSSVPVFLLQFFGPVLVVDGRGVTGCFRRSAEVVRGNLGSIVPFSVVALAIYVVSLEPPTAGYTSPLVESVPALVASGLWAYLLLTVLAAYQIAFYRRVTAQ